MRKKLYIVADATDNSITLSPALCMELATEKGEAYIFVFAIKGENTFGFKRVNPSFAKKTQCGIISYNPVYETVGFITHCPTVNKMFYEMNIQKSKKKLKVEKVTLADGYSIFKIIAP